MSLIISVDLTLDHVIHDHSVVLLVLSMTVSTAGLNYYSVLLFLLIDTTPEGEEVKESSKTDLSGDQQDNDEVEDAVLSQEHQQLQHMIAKTLNDQMKTLKVILM